MALNTFRDIESEMKNTIELARSQVNAIIECELNSGQEEDDEQQQQQQRWQNNATDQERSGHDEFETKKSRAYASANNAAFQRLQRSWIRLQEQVKEKELKVGSLRATHESNFFNEVGLHSPLTQHFASACDCARQRAQCCPTGPSVRRRRSASSRGVQTGAASFDSRRATRLSRPPGA